MPGPFHCEKGIKIRVNWVKRSPITYAGTIAKFAISFTTPAFAMFTSRGTMIALIHIDEVSL